MASSMSTLPKHKLPDCRRLEILTEEDILKLLRHEVEQAGGQAAWSRKHKFDRAHLNRILVGLRPLNATILKLLKIKTLYIHDK
jgi:hypothetical protein